MSISLQVSDTLEYESFRLIDQRFHYNEQDGKFQSRCEERDRPKSKDLIRIEKEIEQNVER